MSKRQQITFSYLLKKAGTSIKKNFFTKRFLYYSVIGCIATLNVAVFSKLYSLIIHDNISSALGYITANIISYFMNAKYTFRKRATLFGYFRFAITYVPNYIIYQLVSIIIINTWHWDPFFATIIASICGVPLTFIIMKIFTFNNRFKR